MAKLQRAGSGSRWGPLFGAGADDWADTWEGSRGWGTSVYETVLHEANIGPGTSVLDCGCGAGRFVRLAADQGAKVAGIDAASALVEIARKRTPYADLRVGDFESLPWPDRTFDVVVGFSTFQFADDHASALREASRVSRGSVWVVIPTRLADSGIPQAFASLIELFPTEVPASLRQSGMYALSTPERLEGLLEATELRARTDDIVESTVAFPDIDTAVRAFLSAGATALAVQHSGRRAVEQALTEALKPLTDDLGTVTLPGWFRVVEAREASGP
jgi:ubiquinone/menaquinone biosynthesis C-methylase UbiE